MQGTRAIAHDGGAPHRTANFSALDQVTLGDGEDEVAGGDIDLPGAELFGVEPIGGGGDDVLDRVRPGRDERVRHARNGEVLIRLSATVSGDRVVLLSGAQPVVHVAHEHAVLNQHVAAGRHALIVDSQRSPAAGQGAVVDGGHDRAGDRLPDLPGEDR